MGDRKVANPVVDTIVTGVPITLTTTTTTATTTTVTKSESSDVNETNIPRVVDCDSTGTVHKNAYNCRLMY
jgi:hypothetical protein